MKLSRRKKGGPSIPVSAMSDIGFLLLIFIMVVSLINYRKEIKIEYPEAKNQEITNAEKNFEIWIDKDGMVFFKGQPITTKALEGLIVEAIVKDPKVRIHILADKNTRYKDVNEIMKVLQLLQHRVVSLVVKS